MVQAFTPEKGKLCFRTAVCAGIQTTNILNAVIYLRTMQRRTTHQNEPHQHDNRKRARSGSRPVTPLLDEDDDNDSSVGNKSPSPNGRNAKLSELFMKLAKLHQSCPLLAEDAWKAYSFHVTAGRLRQLDFEIRDDPAMLSKIRKIPGFGDSTLRMIQEYLSTGTFQRIEAFEADPDRIAMKRMMSIWGVGRVKVGRGPDPQVYGDGRRSFVTHIVPYLGFGAGETGVQRYFTSSKRVGVRETAT